MGRRPTCIVSVPNCVTALIMWVEVCPPSKWVGPDRKPGETGLPAVLHHTWPSSPVPPGPAPRFQSSESRTHAHGGIQSGPTTAPPPESDPGHGSWCHPGLGAAAVSRLYVSAHSDLSSLAPTAVVDLNGRYFGGRVVKACFYNLDKFRVLDLGEQV